MTERESLREAIRRAVDYRGDVTVVRTDGGAIEGFAFDACLDGSADECVRLLAPEASRPEVVRLAEIESVSLSGKDAATGRSWESWIRRYAERKLAGEAASIESEPLG
jgi:hypothetical protein